MDNKTTNKDEAKGSETLNHELMIKHVIALFRDTMPFNQLLGLEFVT
ncbi:MAG TPA: thioesterase family protein, partial [Alteromonas macleodii]|nr:thioesterase family protein [Alteromonas macleodii]